MYNTDIRIARIFNTYGPRMDPEDGRVVSNFINQALRGEKLTVYGDGSQTRSFCYVDDTIEGLLALMDRGEGFGPVNIGNPNEFTILELASHIAQLHGDTGMEFLDLPVDDPTQRCPCISNAGDLGWKPEIELKDGIWMTYKYFKHLGEDK
jgi:UDP-glucuronate decarboxylase